MEDIEQFDQELDLQKDKQLEKKEKKTTELKKVPVPPHRMTPLRNNWPKIVKTLIENMKLQVKMNLKRKCVEIKVSPYTKDPNSL